MVLGGGRPVPTLTVVCRCWVGMDELIEKNYKLYENICQKQKLNVRVVKADTLLVSKSNIFDEEKYHESLVHPAFMASADPPKRVLIVGGGEGE